VSTARIIGRTAADRVSSELTRPGPAPGRTRSILVRTLNRDEVAELVEAISGIVVDGCEREIEIVVSMTEERRSTDAALGSYGSDKPLTYFRNRASRGLVLIELDPFSDVSGQRHLRTITDRDLLGHSDERRWRDQVVAHAWDATGAETPAPPSVLTERLDRLVSAFLTTELALRPWASFVAHTMAAVPSEEVLTPERAERLISNALPVLGLFRDPSLFEHRNLERELGHNRHLAQLRDPSGRDLEQEDWLRRIEDARFGDGQEDESSDEAVGRRAAARTYILSRTEEHRATAPTYREWMRIFDARAKRGLGEQIRAELERIGGAALERFEELGLGPDLDERDREAAQQLVDDDVDLGDGRTLLEVMPAALRRRVERLVAPGTTKVDEPLRGVLQAILSLAGDDGARIVLGLLDPEPPIGTLHAFALVYGPILRRVAEQTAERLKLDPRLVAIAELPSRPENDDEDTFGSEHDGNPWGPLRLTVTTQDGESAINLSWEPQDIGGYALLARTVASEHRTRWPLTVETFSALLEDVLFREPPGYELAPMLEVGSPARDWADERQQFMTTFAADGLDPERMAAYADAWAHRASALVDDVARHPDRREAIVASFLDIDLITTTSGREIWMLASHPLRLRWLARDLHEIGRHVAFALTGQLTLNPENSTLFFSWLERVSPHRQPPMLCSSDRTYLPAQELSLHEQYLRTEVHRSSVGEQMDAKTVGEITAIIETYLDAFPSKVDRFVLLLLTRAGDVRLVEQVLKRVLMERHQRGHLQTVELHLVAPVEHHRRLAGAVSTLPVEASSTRLFPRLRTLLHVWPTDRLPDLSGLVDDVDIAVVPEVLGSSATLNDSTGARSSRGRSFDPWLDKPANVPIASRHRTDVTIELLPAERDSALESWSTLNVRRRRTAVGNDPDDVDRLSLAVDVNRGLELFRQLHNIAQWVVTVDEFVGREQIDSIPDPPDVILVRPGRGKNELYTLVVSSRAGRDFVEGGLRRKLSQMDLDLGPDGLRRLSTRLYDLARNTAPSVVLRAVGLGRTLEEILGLVTTRVLVEQAVPSPPGVGADWWISLDDHTEWFGGALKSRADLARIALRLKETGASLFVDIVESKFRQADDASQAVLQVARTVRILRAGLSVEEQRADSRFWREEIARAIDGVSRRRFSTDDLPGFVPVSDPSDELLDELRAHLRAGDYDLTVRGIACAVAVAAQGQLRVTTENDVQVIRAPRETARTVLRGLADEVGVPKFDALHPAGAIDERARAGLGEPGEGMTEIPSTADRVPIEEGDAVIARPSPRRDRLAPDVLRARLQRVVDKLDELRVPVEVPPEAPFDEGPGFYILRVVPGHGVRVQQIQQRVEDLKLAIGLDMDQGLRTYSHRGALVIEVPKDDSERYVVDAESVWARVPPDPSRLIVPVGEDIAGQPVSLDFSSPDSPHLLVAGMTGSGKSVALETLLRGACRYEPEKVRVLAVDPKRTEMRFLEDHPHLLGGLGLTPHDAATLLERATEEMERRYGIMSSARVSKVEDYNTAVPDNVLPWWIIVLDEYADLAIDPDDRKNIEPKMLRLAQKARAAGIHLILATQRPSADILNTSVRANFSAQLALRVRSITESQIIIGEAGAEALAGKGDALLRTATGVRRVQCAVVQR
jgi:DNA segregation ATPase FtsK/SpoIIIE, S-DNA-T family